MKSICFYFQIHETLELKNYNIFSIGFTDDYFNVEKTKESLARKVRESYLPMNELILKLFEKHGSKFKVTFSISGTTIDLLEKYFPDVLASFVTLSQSGNVEFLAETYNHSLSSLFSEKEFKFQVEKHRNKIYSIFNQKPSTFRNSELLYSNEIGDLVSSLGFDTILAQGINSVLKFKSPNKLYHSKSKNSNLKLLIGNSELSNDLETNFKDSSWKHFPLQSSTYVNWIKDSFVTGDLINLWMDYDVFGFINKKESGIFEFFEHMINELIQEKITFVTPFNLRDLESIELNIPTTISWSNTLNHTNSWLGNSMQKQAAAELYELGEMILEIDNEKLHNDFRELSSSDNFYNMCTHLDTSHFFHGSFSHHESPYESYIFFMNILRDLASRVKQEYTILLEKKGKENTNSETSLEELRVHAMK